MKSQKPPLTPTERYMRRRRLLRYAALTLVIVCIFGYIRHRFRGPVEYLTNERHFKYGSIGSDLDNGFPIEVLKVLPTVFPGYLPESRNPENDLSRFGFVIEPGADLPVGMSRREHGIPLAGLNCALCHVGVVRASPDDEGKAVLGMPANQLRLQEFFSFLFQCASDPRFTSDNLMSEMLQNGFEAGFVDRMLYEKIVIPKFQHALLLRKAQVSEFFDDEHPKWGPGRVDTFNTYKRIQFAHAYIGSQLRPDESIGTADFPSLWNQEIRKEMNLHWDGNNNSIFERNLSASFGAGATRDSVDLSSLDRITEWLHRLPSPRFEDYFPDAVDHVAAARGQVIYQKYCFDCHDPQGGKVGQVDPIDHIRTSPWRLNSYTKEFSGLQAAFGDQYDWDWKHFSKTEGYANAPLDGIWARAPYGHNGSIPSIWALLTPEDERSQAPFYRGHGVIDPVNLGIKTDAKFGGNLPAWQFDVRLKGNENHGHSGKEYGTELVVEEKRDLIEYLKTL
jgi:hypothetical protein